MLGLPSGTNTITTQGTGSTMARLFREQYSPAIVPMDSSDDEHNYQNATFPPLSDSEESDRDVFIPSSENARIRLPSGKTISRKRNSPHTSRHRHRRTTSPNTTSHSHTSRKVHGNCAMIPNPITMKTSTPAPKSRHPPTPPTSDEESETDPSSLVSHSRSTHDLVIPHVRLATHRTTIRSSDAQMLATLPASTQRTLLATSRKAVESAGREEQEYRRKLDGYGNLKSKERFVNDVPGGRSHKNRFMAQ